MTDAADNELKRLSSGGASELAEMFVEYRPRLLRMIDFRMDPRLRGRVDSVDVLQEAFLVISDRLQNFLAKPDVSPFVWIRSLTLQTLVDTHRRHFREKRDVGKEVQKVTRPSPDATSYSIAQAVLAEQTTPSQAMVKAEQVDQLRGALDSMDVTDREVLALRHFEHLSNNETAEALGLSVTAASNRYIRAMARLAQLMQQP